MERKRYENHFIIAREFVVPSEEEVQTQREVIAEIPAQSGIYETDHGELEITVYKPNKNDNTRKVVFSGPMVASEGKRRVVKFPASPKKEVKQPFGEGNHLIFAQKMVPSRGK